MKKRWKSIVAGILAMSLCLVPISVASADTEDDAPSKGYLSFGKDLTDGEKLTVMKSLGVSAVTIANYTEGVVTNAEEHKYLDSYLSQDVIGSKALSSVKVEEAAEGTGLVVETHNITFCTPEMYTNALATAGFTDANIVVAGPYDISGTAALVGAMKAYSAMKGTEIDETTLDAANNELVFTGKLGESIGQIQAAELVALVKNRVVNDNLSSEGDIKKAIKQAASEVGVSLDNTQIQEMTALMTKIKGLNLDINAIKNQAKGIYNKLQSMDIDPDKARGFFGRIGLWFKNLWKKIFG